MIILLNNNIKRLLMNHTSGIKKVKAGDLIEIKNQTYKATFINNPDKQDDDIIIRYELQFGNNNNSDLKLFYISDPLNINENKKSCHIEDGKMLLHNDDEYNIQENNLISNYLDFNDHIDYTRKNRKHHKKKKKRTKNNKKRSYFY